MARIRTVKPELFRHEELYQAEQETGLPLRLCFIGLFTVADRAGCFRWQPRTIKLDVMPYDDVDFSRVLDALATRHFLVRYASGTGEYGVIPTFTRHQVINNREKLSDLPQIEQADAVWPYENNDLLTREARVDHASTTRLVHAQGEGKGREGEQEGEGNTTRQPRAKSSTIGGREMIDTLPGLSPETAEEYRSFRKAKKAPLTSGAWKTICREVGKSGLSPDDALNTAMARGWQGFDASWLVNSSRGGMINRQQQVDDENARVVREIGEREDRRMALEAQQSAIDLGEPIALEGEVIRAY